MWGRDGAMMGVVVGVWFVFKREAGVFGDSLGGIGNWRKCRGNGD